MTDTKTRILEAALNLFSEQGYEAVSVDRIAKAVSIKAPSLYKHYKSKKDIFDSLIAEMRRRYEKHSIFAQTDWNNPDQEQEKFLSMSTEDIIEMVLKQIRFSLHDPYISKTRRLLTIEQFRIQEIADEQEKRVYTDLMKYHTGLIKFWMEHGILQDDDAELCALEFFSPISLQLYRVDRNPDCEEEALYLIQKHICHFFDLHRK